MAKVRKNHTTEFKTKVAVEAIRQQKTINELTAEYGIHATPDQLLEKTGVGSDSRGVFWKTGQGAGKQQHEIDELHRQIGQLIAERDWLKKKSSVSH